jgi:Family of unknown function (DUF5318)
MGSARAGAVVDHRLSRRALVNEYRRGRLRQDQVCDAHPELIRAAANIGEPTTARCPICETANLRLVTYVFGPRLPAQGKVVSNKRDMALFDTRQDDYLAYIVEACVSCRWHHLLRVLPIGGRPNRRVSRSGGT